MEVHVHPDGVEKVVLFDIDGTLLEPGEREVAVFVNAFREHAPKSMLSTDWGKYKARTDIEVTREALSDYLGRPATQFEVDAVLQHYLACAQALLDTPGYQAALVPGAADLLNALAKGSSPGLAIVTGNLRAAAQMRLLQLGWWSHFACGAFAEDGEDKTAIVAVGLQRCRAMWPDTECLRFVIVGDQPVDAVAAAHHGIGFIGVGGTERRRRALVAAGATHVLPDLSDLPYVQNLLTELWDAP